VSRAVSLPLADPQFWIVTAAVAVVALFAARRIRRSLKSESESACASCPKVVAAAPSSAERPRLRVVPVLFAALAAGAAHGATVERTVAAMGTTVTVEVEIATDRATALAVAEAMIREVEATEAALSTWRDDSELAAFNRAPVGDWLPEPSPLVARALFESWLCAEETAGAFDPTVAPLVEAWGLRHGGRVPSATELATAHARVDWRALGFTNHPNRVRKGKAIAIEEGGFGKGAALDAALEVAERAHAAGAIGYVHLDFGGQLAWANTLRPLTVELVDPRDRTRPVLEITLRPGRGSLSTSSNGGRRTASGFGHLLDPRTGRPAADFGSASALDSSALRADCLSTGLFVLGPVEGAKLFTDWNRWHEGIFLVAEGDRLRALVSPYLEGRVRPLDPRVVVEILEMQR
jgi:thiamine biosynthesis lipoprotein